MTSFIFTKGRKKAILKTKVCSRCKEEKEVSEFRLREGVLGKYVSRCNPCSRSARSEYYKTHPDREKTMRRKAHIKKKFGINLEGYSQMLQSQGGVCAICSQPETVLGRGGEVKHLSIDHDASTGRVRGLLCDRCNRAVGLLGDNWIICATAAQYLFGSFGTPLLGVVFDV